jgi:hypothetical protein
MPNTEIPEGDGNEEMIIYKQTHTFTLVEYSTSKVEELILV